MKKLLFTLILWMAAVPAFSTCVEGDIFAEKERWAMARQAYEACAKTRNDADSFYRLGQIYLTAKGVPVDRTQALLYFRYGAEQGYAPAQRELAKLMISPLLPPDAQSKVQAKIAWQKSRLPSLRSVDPNLELSPFAWLLLAAERSENKWFYPSPAVSDEEAQKLSNSWCKTKGKALEEVALRQASRFKEQRLIWAAREVYNDQDFNQFMQMAFPVSGKADYVQRTKAVEKLKQDILKK